MSFFITGFLKTAETDGADKKRAVLVGSTVGGGATLTNAAKNILADMRENRVKRTGTAKQFQKNLKPGDIIFTGGPSYPVTEIEIGKRTFNLPVKEKTWLQAGVGSTHHHAALYVGKGKVFHAPGEGKLYQEPLKDVISQTRAVAYRPAAAKKKEILEALKTKTRLKGKYYKSVPEILSQGLTSLFSPFEGPKSCAKSKEGREVCTTVVTSAYPKQFKKRYTDIGQMKSTKGMVPTATYNLKRIPITLQDHIIAKGVSPILKSLKWGLLAGAGTYAGSKLYSALQKGKKEKAS